VSPAHPLHQLTALVSTEMEGAASAFLEARFGTWPVSFSEPEASQVELSLYLHPEQKPSRKNLSDLATTLQALANAHHNGSDVKIRLAPLATRNWKESWKRHFKPLEIGRRLLLRPSWSRRKARPQQAVVVLDPGLSFGTGQHPTTAFCLKELVRARNARPNQSLLDIGTGSGILAIAAAKLGFVPVQAFDMDPESVRIATKNARCNKVHDRIQFRQADLTRLPRQSPTRFDVVCANLLSDLLVSEKRRLLNLVKRDGVLILAGILNREFSDLNSQFTSAGAQPLHTRCEGEWQSGSYRNPI